MDRKNKIAFVFILIYLIFIAGGSLTTVPLKVKILTWDKAIHILLYIPLGFLLSFPKISSDFILKFFIPLGFGSLYGAILELLQHFVRGRTPSWGDEIANVLGVGMGLGLGFLGIWIHNTQRKRKKRTLETNST